MKTAKNGATGFAVGPANYAGQAFYWCSAVEHVLGLPAVSFSNGNLPFGLGRRGLGFPVHETWPHHRMTTNAGKRLRMRRLLGGVSHVALDGFLPVLGRLDRSDVGADIPTVRRRGVDVALIAHGSDVRDPDAHMQRHQFSYFKECPDDWVACMRERSRRNRAIAAEFAGCVYVSTPDLLMDLPGATWLPLCIDQKLWNPVQAAFSGNDVPTVLHVPSRRVPPIKGTAIIDPILRSMDAAGKIRYLSPERVPHSEMPALVQKADIVVDHILGGFYSVASVEGMAAGRLVVGYVSPDVQAQVIDQAPIVNAPVDRFADVLIGIVEDKGSYVDIASSGPSYVAKWHDGRASAEVIRGFLGL